MTGEKDTLELSERWVENKVVGVGVTVVVGVVVNMVVLVGVVLCMVVIEVVGVRGA